MRALQAYRGSYTHPNVLKARVARAQTFAEQGNLEFAIGETGHVIDDAAILFGPSSFIVGVDLLHLARLQLRAGHVPMAVASADRAKEILKKYLDPGAAGYGSLLEVRGSALLQAGRFREALADLNGAEQLLSKTFGPTYPSAARLRQLRLSAASGEKR